MRCGACDVGGDAASSQRGFIGPYAIPHPPLPATTDHLLKGLSDSCLLLLHPRYSPTKNELVASPKLGD